MPRTENFSTITLDELNAEAGLLTRMDRKYLVPPDDAQEVIDALAPKAQVLQIDGLRSFQYASTYFDTPSLDAFFLAAYKRRRRYKVRTRTYLDSDLCFLEVKTNGSREATVKDRLTYSADDADRLTDEGRDFVVERLVESETCAREDARRVADALVPVMDTTYRRTTLHLPADSARATFDTALTWELFGSDGLRTDRRVLVNKRVVVETKNPFTASPTDRLLWTRGHRPTSLSKYATGMAVLHENLPTNKWHRTITRKLDAYRHDCSTRRDV